MELTVTKYCLSIEFWLFVWYRVAMNMFKTFLLFLKAVSKQSGGW